MKYWFDPALIVGHEGYKHCLESAAYRDLIKVTGDTEAEYEPQCYAFARNEGAQVGIPIVNTVTLVR